MGLKAVRLEPIFKQDDGIILVESGPYLIKLGRKQTGNILIIAMVKGSPEQHTLNSEFMFACKWLGSRESMCEHQQSLSIKSP